MKMALITANNSEPGRFESFCPCHSLKTRIHYEYGFSFCKKCQNSDEIILKIAGLFFTANKFTLIFTLIGRKLTPTEHAEYGHSYLFCMYCIFWAFNFF